MRTSRLIRLGFAFMAAAVVLRCAEESPKKVPMQFVKNERVKDTGGNQVSFNRAVDILFVVDDSGSMGTYQTNLATNVKLFTQSILANQLLDFHIGVVTTDMDSSSRSGRLIGNPSYVTRTTPNGAAALEAALKPGTSGSASELEFDPVRTALTAPLVSGVNAGFYRPDAYLVIIMMTDEDEQSNMSAADFYKFLLGLKGNDASKIINYGVYMAPGDPKCAYGQQTKLESYFKLVSAKTFGLCDVDFGTKLAALGEDLVKRIGTVLYLSRPPQADTIKVTFGSQVVPNDPTRGWIFDPARNALVFGDDVDLKPEPQGTQVLVDFIAAEY